MSRTLADLTAVADHAVARVRGDEHHPLVRAEGAHTAIGALMPGCGS